MTVSLDEMITRLRIIARTCKKQEREAEETLQLVNWLIELKNFKEEENKKIALLEEIIESKDTEIENQELRIEKLEDVLTTLKSNIMHY